jgi:WD40 repeat protein
MGPQHPPADRPTTHRADRGSTAISPDLRTVATNTAGNDYQTANLWDTTTRKQIGHFLHGHNGSVGLTFSPDGKILVTAGSDGGSQLPTTSPSRSAAR